MRGCDDFIQARPVACFIKPYPRNVAVAKYTRVYRNFRHLAVVIT